MYNGKKIEDLTGVETVLIIAANNSPHANRIGVQKITYFLKEKYGLATDCRFESQDTGGPHDKNLNESVAWMLAAGIMERVPQQWEYPFRYRLGKVGQQEYRKVVDSLDSSQREKLFKLYEEIENISKLDFWSLVEFVHK